MKILLLGATGQIGYALMTALARTEHQVAVLVRNASARNFPKTVAVIESHEFTSDAFTAALRDADHVIYAVGLPEQFLFDITVFEKVNCELLATFLDAMKNSRVRGLTYLSTYEAFEVRDGVIDETHSIADEHQLTPYSRSKVLGYKLAVEFARANGIQLTSIHPAAVYGGLNTGDGITDYMENLKLRKWYRLPFINKGTFPVIHVDSLADLIIRSLGAPGAYIASDQMTTLRDIAETMRRETRSYVPMVAPLGLIKLGIFLMEAMAQLIRVKPLLSAVQLDFLTRGWTPDPAKAIRELRWKPTTLDEGIKRYLSKCDKAKSTGLSFQSLATLHRT